MDMVSGGGGMISMAVSLSFRVPFSMVMACRGAVVVGDCGGVDVCCEEFGV